MSEIATIQGGAVAPVSLPTRGALGLAPADSAETSDQLELSDVGQILGRLPGNPSIRAEKVAQIRQAIQNGAYESSQKIDVTVDRLMDALKLR